MRNTISKEFSIAYYNAKCGYTYIMSEEQFSSSDKNERVKDGTYFKRFRYYASCSCEASIYKFNVRRIKIPRMIPHIRLSKTSGKISGIGQLPLSCQCYTSRQSLCESYYIDKYLKRNIVGYQ